MFNLLRFFLSVDNIVSFFSVGVNITQKFVLQNAALFDNRYCVGLLYCVHKHSETAAKKKADTTSKRIRFIV